LGAALHAKEALMMKQIKSPGNIEVKQSFSEIEGEDFIRLDE
jgi:hypothetical protein